MLEFNDINFDIEEFMGKDNIGSLNNISTYLDYSINTTITKQIPNIDEETEKLYAKQILNNYFRGDRNSFTSKNNIRNNVAKIGYQRLINLFIKAMIEKQAYNVTVKHMLNTNDYPAYITNMISRGHYSDIITWLTSNTENIEEAISNYVDLIYRKDIELKSNLEYITIKDYETNKAMEQLNLEMSLAKLKK